MVLELNSAASLADHLESTLESWPGYHVIKDFIQHNPRLEIFLAGGAVRDVVLGRESANDFDFFVSGDGFDSLLRNLGKLGWLESGPLGSPRWYPENSTAKYCDLVPIDRVNHGLGPCAGIQDVLGQFDFTGNAIAYDLKRSEIIDPYQGCLDLAQRTMRATRFDFPDLPLRRGSPITWRATRWFRILHYATKLGLSIEPVTYEWLRANKHYREQVDEFTAVFFRPSLGPFERIGSPASSISRNEAIDDCLEIGEGTKSRLGTPNRTLPSGGDH